MKNSPMVQLKRTKQSSGMNKDLFFFHPGGMFLKSSFATMTAYDTGLALASSDGSTLAWFSADVFADINKLQDAITSNLFDNTSIDWIGLKANG